MTLTSESRRIGIFGGTFDPVHRGHLAVADECAEKLDLHPVLLIPSNLPPHRSPPVASAEDRLAMVQLAVKGHPDLWASEVEVRRGGTSYTVDTISALGSQNPGAELILLLGWDAAVEFAQWRKTAEITRLSRIAVFNRSGSPGPSRSGLLELGLPSDTVILEVDSPPVSATSLRGSMAHDWSGQGLLPAAVEAYIRENHLYQGQSETV